MIPKWLAHGIVTRLVCCILQISWNYIGCHVQYAISFANWQPSSERSIAAQNFTGQALTNLSDGLSCHSSMDALGPVSSSCLYIYIYIYNHWLVVWNMFPYIGNNHPNWLIFSEGLKPPTRLVIGQIHIIFFLVKV